jgi:hypothetical protein
MLREGEQLDDVALVIPVLNEAAVNIIDCDHQSCVRKWACRSRLGKTIATTGVPSHVDI